MTIENISLNLLENGLDFIIRGLDELYVSYNDSEYEERFITPISQPQKDYKYGIIHLFAGFLLLLKEKLARDTPKLIYIGTIEKIDDQLSKGEVPNTVKLDDALKRLKNLPNIENQVIFSDSDTLVIKKVQKYRNIFEHYIIIINNTETLELKNVIISFIDLIDRFLNEHLQININLLDSSPEIRVKILSIKSIYDRIVKESEIAIQARGEEKIKEFKKVRRSVLRNLHEKNKIYFNETNEDYDIFDTCPKCHEETLIFKSEFAGVCTNKKCYEYTPLTKCDKCGIMTQGYDWEETWCKNCEDNQTQMIEDNIDGDDLALYNFS